MLLVTTCEDEMDIDISGLFQETTTSSEAEVQSFQLAPLKELVL